MRFSRDRRGQSVVVGTVILFGFLILAMATYQVQFVPTENAEIEFEHSQQVEGEFLDLRNAVLNTGQSENNRLTSLTLGTRYPQRTFFLNPPPATGELSTSERQTIRIHAKNVTGGTNVEEFWENRMTENNITLNTKSVRYSPSYNEYQNPPDLIYEHSMVVAEFDGAALSRTGQTAVKNNGNRISLTLIDGNLSESGIERHEIDPEVLSQNARSVTLGPDGGEVGITLPTAVQGSEKRDELASDWNETFESGVERTVTATPAGIRIEIRTDDPVELRLAQVGLGSGTDMTDESDGYITKVSKSNGEFVAEVRDQFNNPVEGAEVEVYVDTGATSPIDDSPRTTDESGRVTISDGGGTVGTINGVPPDEAGTDRVVFDEFTPPTVPTGSVYGPNVSGTATNPSTVQQGNSFNLEARVSSIGDSNRIRSGTPIQAVDVLIEDDGGIVYENRFSYNPDESSRTELFSEEISVGMWELGDYDVTVRAQDASGRWTPSEDEGMTTITISEEEGPVSSVAFVASDVAQDSNSQVFAFDTDGLGNGDTVTIDLSNSQEFGGVDYTNGDLEPLQGNDNVVYDETADEIRYTAQGQPDSDRVWIEITGISVVGGDGSTYTVGYSDDAGTTDQDNFEIQPQGTTIISRDTNEVDFDGNVVIEERVSVTGDVTSDYGSVTVRQDATIGGQVETNSDIEIGDRVTVGDGVTSDYGQITIGEESEITGDVETNAAITIQNDATVDGSVITDYGDITVGENAFIDGDVETESGTITIADSATVTGEISEG